jgi:hypothetical protein
MVARQDAIDEPAVVYGLCCPSIVDNDDVSAALGSLGDQLCSLLSEQRFSWAASATVDSPWWLFPAPTRREWGADHPPPPRPTTPCQTPCVFPGGAAGRPWSQNGSLPFSAMPDRADDERERLSANHRRCVRNKRSQHITLQESCAGENNNKLPAMVGRRRAPVRRCTRPCQSTARRSR